MVVQFDKYSAETGWFIDSADGETNYVARPLGYYQDMPNGKVEETVILPEGLNYKFKIIDLVSLILDVAFGTAPLASSILYQLSHNAMIYKY